MLRHLLLAALIAGSSLLPVAAQEAAPSKHVVVYGSGVKACSDHLARRDAKDTAWDQSLSVWVAGYVTGMNESVDELALQYSESMDSGGIVAHFDKFCRDRPTATMREGAATLFRGVALR